MIRIAVCDDDADCLSTTAQMIEKWSTESGIPVEIYRFDNGDALLNKTAALCMDIIFLDIIMPLLDGIETARELRQNNKVAKIIFLTSSPEFALQSYEIKAQDYLLKPISFPRIKEVLDECSPIFHREPKNIVLKTSYGYQKLYFHDIEYAEAQNKKVIFHLRSGKSVVTAEALNALENRLLGEDGFFKSHRSYIIYLPNIDHFNTADITTKSGKNIPIARGYGKAFQEAYFALMFQE